MGRTEFTGTPDPSEWIVRGAPVSRVPGTTKITEYFYKPKERFSFPFFWKCSFFHKIIYYNYIDRNMVILT